MAAAVATVVLAGSSSIPSGTVRATTDAEITVTSGPANASLRPQPELSIWTWDAAVLGGQATYFANLSYNEAAIAVTSTLAAENTGALAATVEYVSVVLEKRFAGQSEWVPFAAFESVADDWTPTEPAPTLGVEPLEVSTASEQAAGVEYGDVDPYLIGTAIEPGSTANWQLTALVFLQGSQISELLDEAAVDGIRQVVHFEVSPRDPAAGQPFSADADFTAGLQAADLALADGVITIQPPTGAAAVFDDATTPALASVALGDAPVEVSTSYQIPAGTERGAGETPDAYIERLKRFGALRTTTSFMATGEGGLVNAEALHSFSVSVPILVLGENEDPTNGRGGEPLWQDVHLDNIGGAATASTSLDASLPSGVQGDTSWVPDVIQPGRETVSIEYPLPVDHPEGTFATSIEITWTDGAGNAYGPLTLGPEVWISNGAAGAPRAEIDLPSDTLFGTETFDPWGIEDDVAVTSVEILIDGASVAVDSTEPFSLAVDTEAVTDGEHIFQVRANDADGNASTSSPRLGTVANDLSSPERVEVDHASGRLSAEEAVVNAAYAFTGSDLLPERYAAGDGTSADALFASFVLASSVTADRVSDTTAIFGSLRDWDALEATLRQQVVAIYDDHFEELKSTPVVGLQPVNGFAQHCLHPAEMCRVETAQFSGWYTLDASDNAVEPVDRLTATLATCAHVPAALAGAGLCNGIPDSIDRLLAGLEHAWGVFVDLGYTEPDGGTVEFTVTSRPGGRSFVGPIGGIGFDVVGVEATPFSRPSFVRRGTRSCLASSVSLRLKPSRT